MKQSLVFSSRTWWHVVVVILLLAQIVSADDDNVAAQDTDAAPLEYGVDVSFPMQHAQVTETPKPFGDSVMTFYNSFLEGCRDFYKERAERCNESEQSRLNLNLQQPSNMQVPRRIGVLLF